jgi:hypothetical protein
MANSKNRYTFDTELEGFIRLGEDGGKFNNQSFSFTLPDDIFEQAEKDREELLAWARTKCENPKRVTTNVPKWDEQGLVKISFGGETGRTCIFIDTEGQPIPVPVLKQVSKGTKVRIIAQHSPYSKPALGTTLKVLGVMIIELKTFGGAADSGDLSVEDVASLFGKVEGFKASSPAVRKAADEGAEAYEIDF